MYTLEQTREIDGATLQDEDGRYYRVSVEGGRNYGYHARFGGAFICYTCGHLCECESEQEQW